jgi:hypothetical protein
MSRYLPLSLSVLLLATFASGCCCIDRVYCPSGCGNEWDPVLGSCEGCGSCGDGGSCGGGDCTGKTPCQLARHGLTCGAGCGEIYWGEWTSDPPDECDPCDDCGNYIGPRCCPPRWWERLKAGSSGLWGWRCGAEACCDHGSGCSSCGGDHDVISGPTPAPGIISSPGTIISPETIPGPITNGRVIEGDVIPSQPADSRPSIPRPKTGPTEAKPNGAMPAEPMPNTSAMRTRSHRHSPAQPQLLQPTRSARAPHPAARSNPSRTRNL